MRVDLQPAYVLHSRPYRDTSAIIELFTPEYGRLSAVPRGVRRQSRRRSSSARSQPFSPLLVSFSGRAELKTLVASESAGQPHVLAGNSLFSGLYMNELLVRLLHRHDPHPELFAFYAATLKDLSAGAALEPVLREFELKLLDDLGYSFDFSVDAQTGLDSWIIGHSSLPRKRAQIISGLAPLNSCQEARIAKAITYSSSSDRLNSTRLPPRLAAASAAPPLSWTFGAPKSS